MNLPTKKGAKFNKNETKSAKRGRNKRIGWLKRGKTLLAD